MAFLQSSAAGLAHSGLLNGSSGSPRAAGPYSVVPTSSASEEVAGSPQTPSLIRTLFHTIVVKEGNKMFLAVGVLTVVITIVRALLVNQSDLGATSYRSLSYDDWVSSILLPSTTASLFFLPLALPVALILAEALATSSVLANAEITLRPPAVIKKKDSSSAASAIGVDSLGSSSGGGTADSGHKDSTQPLLGSKAAASTNKNKSRNGSHGSESSAQQRRDTNDDDDNDDAGEIFLSFSFPCARLSARLFTLYVNVTPPTFIEMEDEFMDEDIDERAEDIAESISTQVCVCLTHAWEWNGECVCVCMCPLWFRTNILRNLRVCVCFYSCRRCAGPAFSATWAVYCGTACSWGYILQHKSPAASVAPAVPIAPAHLTELWQVKVRMMLTCRFRWPAHGCWRYSAP